MNRRRVLFLCTGNSCRSQMAEGLLRHTAGDQFDVHSAGTRPAGLNPAAVSVMRELGIDISAQRSKSVTDFLGQPFDFVITVCDSANESCPVFPGTHRVHWGFEDPAAAQGTPEQCEAVFRRVRDEIAANIQRFVANPIEQR